MTDLEKMKYAKEYLEKLADGINPITNQPIPKFDIVNNVHISRCLFYTADILRQVIEAGGDIGNAKKANKAKKIPFSISYEDVKRFSLSKQPISVSEITKRLNDLIDPETMTKLKYTSITTFLMQSGFLAPAETTDGATTRIPTAQGKTIGISIEEREGQNGKYRVTVYNSNAQQFILDNIDAVIEENAKKKQKTTELAEKQGEPWTDNYDEALVDLFRKHVPVSEIAVTLKRSEGGIRARLKRLGLIEKRSDAI